MPNGSGGSGRGSGQGSGQGQGQGAGKGQGQGAGQGTGGVATCVCPSCGQETPHQRGTPCVKMNCPNCGARMIGKR